MTLRSHRTFPGWLTALAILALAAAGCGHAGISGAPENVFNAEYPAWNVVLARYVTHEGVNYTGLRQHPESLHEALKEMQAVRRSDFESWTPAQRVSFLINAHNAFAIDRITRSYPVPSLEKTGGWGSARDQRDIVLLGRRWSLRQLADEVISDRYLDARSIFLLNWAEVGCPPLPPVPVTDRNLPDLLDRQPRKFLSTERNCQYDKRGKVIYLSPLIKESQASIERDFTTLWEFLKRYLPADQSAQITRHPPRLRWLDFDPSLDDANLEPLPRLEVSSDPQAAEPAAARAK